MQDFDGKCYEKTPEVIRVSRSVVLYNGEGIALFIICGERYRDIYSLNIFLQLLTPHLRATNKI